MTEPERNKQQTPVDATSPADSPDTDEFETPMLAVWLSLGLILVAGLYGLYLGTNAKHESKEKAATSGLSTPPTMKLTAFAARDLTRIGHES